MPCMCGATDCPSCGVAQGTVCPVCLMQYDEDGRCHCDEEPDVDVYDTPDGPVAKYWDRGRWRTRRL